MNVRAKFLITQVRHVHQSGDNVLAEISAIPVYGDGQDNASWSKATPSGSLTMMVTNPAAIQAFELGKSYYLDFTPA